MPSYIISKTARVIIAGGLLSIALFILIGGLVYHQLIRYREFFEQSESNRIRVQPIVPKRGLILDRHRQVIADNRVSFTVSIVPFERIAGVTVPRISELLDMDSLTVEKKAAANFISKYIPSPIRRGLGPDIISILEERSKDYPGVTYSVESVRRYIEHISAGTFVGHVGEVSSEEIKSPQYRDYRPGSMIGKEGIEKTYDRLLRGIEGTEYVEISARGQIVGVYEGKKRIPAVPGNDLILTIDKDLQAFAAAAFDSLGHNGAIVAIDPQNGEILALASFPYFDPNLFSGVIPPEVWQAVVADTNHPLLNRPLAGLYPPGSTIKLLTAGAALQSGLVTDEDLLKPCYGGMQFGNRYFRCWDAAGHGRLNIYGAIEQSCDVYFYQVGQIMGIDSWSVFAGQCGFGKKAGIDIPGELAGDLPSSAYYDTLYGPSNWSPNLVLNLAIGQGELTVTPLQLAQFYCGLANYGRIYRPHLLKGIIFPDGSSEEIAAVVSITLPFSQKTISILSKALKLVVNGEHGTARGIRNKKYEISGKTGTAQNPHGEDHSWFVGFAPSDAPEIVVTTLVENAGHGSEVAAPLAAKVINEYLSHEMNQLAGSPDSIKR